MRWRRLSGAALLTAVSAGLYALAFPPFGWLPLAWVGLAPFLVALRRGGLGRAVFLAWFWCVVGACAAASWFPSAVADYFHQPMPLALALFVAVFTLMAAPYFMAFAAVYRALARRAQVALPLLAGAAWVGAELGRGRLFTGTPFFIGNPWGLLGYSQVELLPLVQIAAVTGIYGVSFAVLCVDAALAELWLAWRDRDRSLRRAAAGLLLALLPGAAFALYGLAVLSRADAGDAPATRVAVVQGNLAMDSRWRSDLYGANLDVYLEQTRRLAAEGDGPEVVFWPESAMTFFLEGEPLYRQAIAHVLRAGDAELVAGGPRAVGDAQPRFFNSIYVLAPDGEIRARYDKQYLVPFAEYFPLDIDVLRRRFGRIRFFEHGRRTAPLPTRAGPAGVVVCNEAMLPEVVADRVDRGAAYLVNPSNDTWISDRQYTEQQFDIALVRAVEQRRYLVRASTAGPSAVIDPWGRVQVETQPLARAAIRGEVRARTDRTPYGRVGDLFAVACVVAVTAALVARRPP